MAEIRTFPLVSHMRADTSQHVLCWRGGRLVASGRGLALWFLPLSTSIAEVPMDLREQSFLFHGRSVDFQDVTTQGTLTYRVVDPEAVAASLDFTIDLARGTHVRDPLESLATTLTGLAQREAWAYIAAHPVRTILAEGPTVIRARVEQALLDDASLKAMGIAVTAVAVHVVRPDPDTERALEAPVRERIQQEADEAAFARRALAVEKERAIQENELQNRIELARRNEQLIAQEGTNERRTATEKAEAKRIGAQGEADRTRVLGEAEAERLRAVEGARVALEREHVSVYQDLAPGVLLALAAHQLAGKLEHIAIEHLTLAPDSLGPMLQSLLGAGAKRLRGPEA
jgi:regulator of protease activity HflC (stomatin/prohibitin superfamily)